MRKKIVISIIGAAGLLLAAGVAPAMADTTNTTNATVSGGNLTFTDSNAAITLTGDALTGTKQNMTGSASNWTVTDARGTGAAWAVQVSAPDLISAAGSTETTPRTIAIGNLSIDPGTIAKGTTDADPVDGISMNTVTMTTSAQALVSAGTTHKGTYTFSPAFTLSIPANAYRSNYTTGSTGPMNPYTTVITITIG